MKFRLLLILLIGILTASSQFGNTDAREHKITMIPEFELAAENFDISPSGSHLSLPRQTNLTNIPRTYTNAKRIQNIGFSKTCTLNKAGQLTAAHEDITAATTENLQSCHCSDAGLYLISIGILII